eukprot:CAMPEP_0171083164 /NCGR_PEP_ID=MMETSP0766_2-20121228/17551_1 /TAXON_ID=439317 /ORGANISM="Gambierdiscus australes, Strain CAWD 149" /LENGTH=104 /DNA_ID=CAMNT_0011540583 /DNA_START=382 /DNA_END=695 /DNA_ORIENTATION=-
MRRLTNTRSDSAKAIAADMRMEASSAGTAGRGVLLQALRERQQQRPATPLCSARINRVVSLCSICHSRQEGVVFKTRGVQARAVAVHRPQQAIVWIALQRESMV